METEELICKYKVITLEEGEGKESEVIVGNVMRLLSVVHLLDSKFYNW